jgi:hypothetical protein
LAHRVVQIKRATQPPSHGSNIPRGNISSTDNVRQSSHILGNSIEIRTSDDPIGNYNESLAQKISAGSKSTGKQTGNTSGNINNIVQSSNSVVSEVGKNLTDASGPSLEFFGKYLRLKQSLGLTINSQF